MQPEESIQESRKLLKTRYGQNYKTSIAYVKCVTNGPSITYEDSQVLQKFSVHLMSCKNTSKEIGCLNNVETPDSLQRLIERLPFQLSKDGTMLLMTSLVTSREKSRWRIFQDFWNRRPGP